MHSRAIALRVSTTIALASIAASPLAGCSGASSTLPAAPAPIAAANAATNATGSATLGSIGSTLGMDAKKKKKQQLLFVSDNENNRVLVYNAASKTQNPPAIRTITSGVSGPNGLTTDQAGNLYVANYVSGTVTVYAPNASTPKTTISSGLNGPWDVKVDGSGNVYIANDPLFGSTPAFISEYPAGSSSPSYTWQVPQQGMTISGFALLNPLQPSETSIYALEYTLNGSDLATGGALTCYPGNQTCTQLGGYSFGQTGGIAVANSPNGNPFEFLAVDQYVPGVDTFTQSQPMQQLVTGGTPEFIALNSKDNQLFVADRFYGRVVEYSFPAGKQMNSFSPGGAQVYGVATYPAGTYH
ncbi:MAG: hypothetical protein WA814_02350 [Candidatus Baltobacteraceae bacterium]